MLLQATPHSGKAKHLQLLELSLFILQGQSCIAQAWINLLQWNQVAEKFIGVVFERGMSYLPSHKNFGNFSSKRFRHLPAAHVGNAVQSKAHEGGVPAGQVILDGVVYQANELAVRVHQHGDEQIAL